MSGILYVSRSGIPNDAASLRIERISQLLRKIGYEVSIMSTVLNSEYIPIKDSRDEYRIVVNDISYLFPYRKKHKWYNKYKVVFEIIFAFSIYKRVVRYCEHSKPDYIILYNDIYTLTKRLLKYCRRNKIELYADVTEWYEKKSSKSALPARLVPVLVNKRITRLDKRLNGIITISPYLYQYYRRSNSNVVFIPPLMPIKQQIKFKSNKVRTLVYAGKPGEKDILVPLLEAFKLLNAKHIRAVVNIIGIDEDYIRQIWEKTEFRQYGIQIYGYLPHEDAIKMIETSDFGILLRYDKRYAKAGFSTKLAECLSLGVPMLCNRIGGCDSVIDNNEDGLIIDDYEVGTILNCLEAIVALPKECVLEMKYNAINKANKLFNPEKYIGTLKLLLLNEDTNISR